MKNQKTLEEIVEILMEIFEDNNGYVPRQSEIASFIGLGDKSQYNKILKGNRELKISEAQKLAEFFNVPLEVIIGKMDIDNIPAINKDGLCELSFLARKWIYDNSQTEETKRRVKMLNRILCNPRTANLLFDTLDAYTVGFSVRVNSLQDVFTKEQIERTLFKELILSELDEFFIDIYKRTSEEREKRSEEIMKLLNHVKTSKNIAYQARIDEEAIELKTIQEEISMGKEEMRIENE